MVKSNRSINPVKPAGGVFDSSDSEYPIADDEIPITKVST
jgi:hypothetical protein